MNTIVQIQNLNKSELISIIENAIDSRLNAFNEKPKPETLTVKESASLLKVSPQTVHKYIKKGFISAQKVGRILLIKRIDIEQSLNEVKSLRYKRS
jgi:excisionase family DNA binding protein